MNLAGTLMLVLAVARVSLRPGETPEQAQERRLRESQEVESRVVHIGDMDDWDRATQSAGTDLVVIEVGTHSHCICLPCCWLVALVLDKHPGSSGG